MYDTYVKIDTFFKILVVQGTCCNFLSYLVSNFTGLTYNKINSAPKRGWLDGNSASNSRVR